MGSLSPLDHWAGDRRQSVFLPQHCFYGFTLNPSPLRAGRVKRRISSERSYSKLNKHLAKYVPLTPAQQWEVLVGCELDCHPCPFLSFPGSLTPWHALVLLEALLDVFFA